jgi:biofilm protein TabA
MIFDSTSHFNGYLSIHSLFGIVSKFLSSHALNRIRLLKTDKIELSHGVFAVASEYEAKNIQSSFLECHRRYIDIHIVSKGAEQLGVCNRQECKVSQKYDEQKDFEKVNGEMDLITLRPGFFAIFFPQDAHMPGLKTGRKKQRISKIVFKVPAKPF